MLVWIVLALLFNALALFYNNTNVGYIIFYVSLPCFISLFSDINCFNKCKICECKKSVLFIRYKKLWTEKKMSYFCNSITSCEMVNQLQWVYHICIRWAIWCIEVLCYCIKYNKCINAYVSLCLLCMQYIFLQQPQFIYF